MIDYQPTESELLERIHSLPEEVQKVLMAPETNELILAIGTKNNISDPDKLVLRQITALTLMGLSPVSDLSTKIRVEIKSTANDAIIREIEERIINPIKTKLTRPNQVPPAPTPRPTPVGSVAINDIHPAPEKQEFPKIAPKLNEIKYSEISRPADGPKPVILHQESTYKPITLAPDISLKVRERGNQNTTSTDLFQTGKTNLPNGAKQVAEIEFGKTPGKLETTPASKIAPLDTSNLTPFRPNATPINKESQPSVATRNTLPQPVMPGKTEVPPIKNTPITPPPSLSSIKTTLPTSPNPLLSPFFKPTGSPVMPLPPNPPKPIKTLEVPMPLPPKP